MLELKKFIDLRPPTFVEVPQSATAAENVLTENVLKSITPLIWKVCKDTWDVTRNTHRQFNDFEHVLAWKMFSLNFFIYRS
ncbi:unnamed protein product [Caenorhabditis sp. 36 PRJEB53466]|nr:unnamed protein product [Caenorhabditis sp. 36 PRJEB53466]